jgi:bifunctional UDP-N-acetylglucosamine pyrophosphorylase / glucosamine-1-phosphate N-acetyltransferase
LNSAEPRLLIVPAAGAGSRLSTSLPKLLVPVAGRPMIDHIVAKYAEIVSRVIVVVSPAVEAAVREHFRGSVLPVELAIQPRPTGMLDAILAPLDRVRELHPAWIWITWCDQIAVSPQTVSEIRAACETAVAPDLVLATARLSEPYIHLARDADGRITGVLQRREGDAMPPQGESDSGLFAMTRQAYVDWLPAFATSGTEVGTITHERNFLPFVPWIASRAVVRSVPVHDTIETVGINTPADLRLVEDHFAALPPSSEGDEPQGSAQPS